VLCGSLEGTWPLHVRRVGGLHGYGAGWWSGCVHVFFRPSWMLVAVMSMSVNLSMQLSGVCVGLGRGFACAAGHFELCG
jgi:hypothetical protein